ncbi:MAG: InlB B-repeat-containing protein, partial [Treponema sp.]|nr:InlB B-repeat-containing protein [Treponema sp.]
MKNFFRIAAIFFAFGLAAAFASCSNAAGGGDNHAPTPTTTTYTVSFDANDGSQNPAKATQIFTAGTPQNLTPIADLGFKRDNFAFAGWALSSAASQAAYADKAEYTGNISITLYAVWTPIYTVTFDSKGGSEVAGQKVTSGQTATRPDDPAKEHFNFAGWCSDENCQTPFDFAAPITAPTTLYAKWSDLPVYVVTFDLNGGKYGSSDSYTQHVESGGKAVRPANDPTKDDSVGTDVTTKYAFENWYADSGCGTLFDFDATAISGVTTVYTKWSETKCYAVKIASGIEHGSVSLDATEHVAAGTLVTLTANPSVGYKLDSYSVTDVDSNPVAVTNGKFTMPASPVTVFASFIAIEYTITCGTPENGTLTADKAKTTIGTTVTLTVSANDGYKFNNVRVKDSNGTDVSVTEVAAGASYTFTMPADNVTITAAFRTYIPLTLEAIEAGANVTFTNWASGPVTYRVNEGDSQTIARYASKSITLTNVGDKVCFYGNNATYTSDYYSCGSNIACDKDCYIYGNIMSLVDSENYENARELTDTETFQEL